MGENSFAPVPTARYGGVLLMAALAYSLVAYAVAIPAAFVRPWIAGALYVAVALVWLVPDRRIERALSEQREIDSR